MFYEIQFCKSIIYKKSKKERETKSVIEYIELLDSGENLKEKMHSRFNSIEKYAIPLGMAYKFSFGSTYKDTVTIGFSTSILVDLTAN